VRQIRFAAVETVSYLNGLQSIHESIGPSDFHMQGTRARSLGEVRMNRALKQGTDIRKLTLNEFAEQFETAIKERHELSIRLDKAREEIATLMRGRAEFEKERVFLNAEIAKLRDQVADLAKKRETSKEDIARTECLVAAREKLIRDEFERKFQELTVQVRNQRKKYTQEMEVMKKRLKSCMCQSTTWD
jgi:septal ring factor EnvC (AmiA/AmiB activator)